MGLQSAASEIIGARLRRRARLARWLCLLAALATAIGFAAIAVDDGLLRDALRRSLHPGALITVTPVARIAAVLAALAPAAALAWAMLRLAAMFRRMESGRVMDAANARSLAGAGVLFMASAGLAVLAHTGLALAATLANPPGQRMLSVQIGSPEIASAAIGAALLAFGLVMSEAARLAEDNEAIV